ncbi:Chitin-binding, type 1, conserved site [Phytophthora cactorum]|nr:Chitin-binding, type 1, conserved site [Phytophthora cactorum]
MTWVVNPFYDKNAPAAFYDASSTFGRNPLDIYPNLRYVVDRDTPYTNIPVIAANANKKCGMTSATGPTRSISGSFRFDVDPAALHEVCENILITETVAQRTVSHCIWSDHYQAPSTQAPNTLAPTQAPTTSPTSCTNVAANGGSCGTANGGKYCPGTQCCSQYGYCGVGTAWCTSNPNSIYNGNGKCSGGGGGVVCSQVAPMEAVVVQAMAACTARAPSAVVNTATAEWGHHGATTTPIPSTMEEAAPSVLRVLQYYSKLYE